MADPNKFWKLTRWAKQPKENTLPQFPAIRAANGTLQTTEEGKAEALAAHFFPPPVIADLSDITDEGTQAELLPIEPTVLEEDVKKAIKRLPRNKAPGPDEIPNEALKECADVLAPPLSNIFTACLRLGYHPTRWRSSITVVLRKPQKPDYTQPKAYRPIALLNTMAKLLEAIVARRMSELAEERKLLPETQMGARPGRSTLSALESLVEQVRTAWGQGNNKVVSMLCLDISGAFDKVSHERLLYILQCKGFPQWTRNFIESFLKNRTTSIRIGGFTSPERPTETGIPQGSTISPILFLFFASGLLPELESEDTSAIGFVDDTNILAFGETTEGNCKRLERAHEKCVEWAARHGAKFAPEKYQLIHFTRTRTRKRERHNRKARTRIPGFEGAPAESLRFLGVQVDSKLNWKANLKAAKAKGEHITQALRSLTQSTWGAGLLRTRQIYTTIIRPALTYGCQIWAPQAGNGINSIAKVQHANLRQIVGAYRTTPTIALHKEAGIPPLKEYTDAMAAEYSTKSNMTEATKEIRRRCQKIQARLRYRTAQCTPYTLQRDRILAQQEDAQRDKSTKFPRWEKTWETTAREKRAQSSKHPPTWWAQGRNDKARHRLHKGLSRPESTISTLLRTEHIGLKAYLYRRKVPGITSGACECGELQQTGKHILLFCPRTAKGRQEMFQKIGSTAYRDILTSTRGMKIAARYILQTGILEQFRLIQEQEERQKARERRRSEDGRTPEEE